jgi:hypothetical protein
VLLLVLAAGVAFAAGLGGGCGGVCAGAGGVASAVRVVAVVGHLLVISLVS